VSEEGDVASFFADLSCGIDGVVNCAGISSLNERLEDVSLRAFRRVLDVNLTGTFLICRAALPLLRSRGGGSIVNISSVHAVVASSGQGPYAASKAGIVALTRQIAVDYAADRIRANSVLMSVDGIRGHPNHPSSSGQSGVARSIGLELRSRRAGSNRFPGRSCGHRGVSAWRRFNLYNGFRSPCRRRPDGEHSVRTDDMANNVQREDVTISWLGQAGFAVRGVGVTVAIDPYLSDLCRHVHGLPRAMIAPCTPTELSANLVLVSHWHEDHLDLDSAQEFVAAGAHFIAPESCVARLAGRGIPASSLVSIRAGQTIGVPVPRSPLYPRATRLVLHPSGS